MKKATRFSLIITLFLVAFFVPENSEASVLVDRSIIGANFDVTPDSSFSPTTTDSYTLLLQTGSSLSFPAIVYETVTADPAFLKVKLSSGSCNANNISIITRNGTALNKAIAQGAVDGSFCVHPITGTATSSWDFAGISYCRISPCNDVTENIILEGSTYNETTRYNGLGTKIGDGGFAFQICDSMGCDGGFYHSFSASSTRIYNISPNIVYTATSTLVNFFFDWYVTATDAQKYGEACIAVIYANSMLTGGSGGQSINPVCQDSIAGTQSYAQTYALEDNQSYYWYPYLKASSTVNNFNMPSRYLIIGTDPSTYSSLYQYPTTDSEATTSIGQNAQRILGFYTIIFSKFPFNWVEGAVNGVIAIDTDLSDPYQFDGVVIQVAHLGSSTVTNAGIATTTYLNRSFTLFSTSTLATISSVDAIQTARTVGSWMLWLLLISFVLSEVVGIFNQNALESRRNSMTLDMR